MAFKAYFDGGNKPERHDVITLAALSGSGIQWNNFTEQWKTVLKRHRASFLHIADAMTGAPNSPFKKNAWTEAQVGSFVEDCVSVIERCTTTRKGDEFVYLGLRPVTVSVLVRDFKKALARIPDLGSIENLCVIHAAAHCNAYGLMTGHHKFQFFFDQGEAFYGHLCDRIRNKKAKKAAPGIQSVHLEQANMREVPALQAADLFAWAINRTYKDGSARFEWQKRLLAIDRDEEVFRYARLLKPNREHIDIVKSWELPPRRPLI
jgi:hypothetical protein